MSRTYHHKMYGKWEGKHSFKATPVYSKWSEPSWFKRITTTKRNRAYFQRAKASIYRSIDLETIDIFNVWSKPHVYYW